MLAPVTHILPLTTIRKERFLPIPGKVLVRRGQKVSATDTIAEANLDPQHLLMDLVRGLGLPASKTDQYIQVKEGDLVAEGDVLAGPVGFPKRLIRSPDNGRVILTGSGSILLEVQGRPFELKAALPGVVIELMAERGAIIETTGALIQGVWGNGGIDFGLLNILAHLPDEILTSDRLDFSLRGSMVLAGHIADQEVLKTAADLPLRGLVISSMHPSLIPLAKKMPFPLIVIEGFGHQPMNSAAFKLLSTSERREVALNAEPWDRYAGTRPEVVIPLPASGEPPLPRDNDFFAPGQQVLVVRAPWSGKIGTLVALSGITVLPCGLRAQAAEVRLENGENVVLPLANLEILA